MSGLPLPVFDPKVLEPGVVRLIECDEDEVVGSGHGGDLAARERRGPPGHDQARPRGGTPPSGPLVVRQDLDGPGDSGAAGPRAAIAVYEAGSKVVVVGKRLRKDAHTMLAAGSINAALGTVDPGDSWQHLADTHKEGYFLADPFAVGIMACETPHIAGRLLE
jgi:hypothetical protein